MEQIQDRGLVVKVIPHGNTSQITTIFSEHHGMVSGYFQGGLKTKGKMGVCTIGNIVEFSWHTRVTTHLGKTEICITENFSTVFAKDILKLSIIQSVCEILFMAIKEHDPHPEMFKYVLDLFHKVKHGNPLLQTRELANYIIQLYIDFEIKLLEMLGFGFNFEKCNISGKAKPEFISPKTGNAVSAEIAKGHEAKLFRIPKFISEKTTPDQDEIKKMMDINLHFLKLHLNHKEYNVRNFLEKIYKAA